MTRRRLVLILALVAILTAAVLRWLTTTLKEMP